MERVTIQWGDTAKATLQMLSLADRRGLWNKVDDLRMGEKPILNFKPVFGPLQGLYRVCHSRYRAVYSVESENLVNGDILHHVSVRFIATGQRLETGKQEIYQLAQKLIDLGLGATGDVGGTASPEPSKLI